MGQNRSYSGTDTCIPAVSKLALGTLLPLLHIKTTAAAIVRFLVNDIVFVFGYEVRRLIVVQRHFREVKWTIGV